MRKEAKTSEAGGKAEKFLAEDQAEYNKSSGQKTSEAGGQAEKFGQKTGQKTKSSGQKRRRCGDDKERK